MDRTLLTYRNNTIIALFAAIEATDKLVLNHRIDRNNWSYDRALGTKETYSYTGYDFRIGKGKAQQVFTLIEMKEYVTEMFFDFHSIEVFDKFEHRKEYFLI